MDGGLEAKIHEGGEFIRPVHLHRLRRFPSAFANCFPFPGVTKYVAATITPGRPQVRMNTVSFAFAVQSPKAMRASAFMLG